VEPSVAEARDVVIVGAGPAGLRAAEVATLHGARVLLCDAQPSAGRKVLIAGRGGLNLTHSEPVENFPARYGADRALARFFPLEPVLTCPARIEIETYGERVLAFLAAEPRHCFGHGRTIARGGVEFRSARACVA
jgi:choline dehydrogenase-like flavoprotein